MTLPSSGTIKFSDIRTELNVGSQAPFSLDSASNGTYAAINQASTSKPSGTNPDSASEWYGYYHDAKYAINVFDMTADISINPCCGRPSTTTVYSNCSSLALNCYVYTTNGNSNPYAYAYLGDLLAGSYYITDGNGQITSNPNCFC